MALKLSYTLTVTCTDASATVLIDGVEQSSITDYGVVVTVSHLWKVVKDGCVPVWGRWDATADLTVSVNAVLWLLSEAEPYPAPEELGAMHVRDAQGAERTCALYGDVTEGAWDNGLVCDRFKVGGAAAYSGAVSGDGLSQSDVNAMFGGEDVASGLVMHGDEGAFQILTAMPVLIDVRPYLYGNEWSDSRFSTATNKPAVTDDILVYVNGVLTDGWTALAVPGETVRITVEKDGCRAHDEEFVVPECRDVIRYVYLEEDEEDVFFGVFVSLDDGGSGRAVTFIVSPSDALLDVNGVKFLPDTGRYTFNTADGEELVWSVSKDGYVTKSGTHVVNGDAVIRVTLEEDALKLGVSSISFGHEGGTKTYTLTSGTAWTLVSRPDWLAVEPEGGDGTCDVSFTAVANGGDARDGEVVFSNENLTLSVGVKQSAETVVEPDLLTFSSTSVRLGEEFTMAVSGTSKSVSVARQGSGYDGLTLTFGGTEYDIVASEASLPVTPGNEYSLTFNYTEKGSAVTAVWPHYVSFTYGGAEYTISVTSTAH